MKPLNSKIKIANKIITTKTPFENQVIVFAKEDVASAVEEFFIGVQEKAYTQDNRLSVEDVKELLLENIGSFSNNSPQDAVPSFKEDIPLKTEHNRDEDKEPDDSKFTKDSIDSGSLNSICLHEDFDEDCSNCRKKFKPKEKKNGC